MSLIITKYLLSRMDNDEEVRCRVVYLDVVDGAEEETCWIKRAGNVKVTYPNGHTFEGNTAQFSGVSLLFKSQLAGSLTRRPLPF